MEHPGTAFALPNLLSQKISKLDPWSFAPHVPDTVLADKDAFVKWGVSARTEHCYYSLVEGVTPGLRVTSHNEPCKIHGIVADFDTAIGTALLDRIRTRPPGEFMPNWIHRTRFSGGVRLVWLFSAPALVYDARMANKFLEIALSKIKVAKFLPGLDRDCAVKATSYYEAGTAWEKLSEAKISDDFTGLWLFNAGDKIKWATLNNPIIPLADLEQELQKRWPGAWPGTFALGVSGPRFWDQSADNPRGAIIRETGMQCFTGATAFVPWASIFGREFVEKYRAETLGAIMQGTWYDGKFYWRKTESGAWNPWTKDDLKLCLRVQHGISQKAKDSNSSEMDEVLNGIHEQRRVEAALPFVHQPDGLIAYNNSRYLNISQCRCMVPSDEPVTKWGDGFEWTAKFLDGLFADDSQKTWFLAWLKRYYEGGVRQSPRLGQAVILAGPVDRGKTLLSTGLISRIVGGHADASAYFLGDERFTSHILSMPLMTIDDTSPATDTLRHVRYSTMLKKLTANQWHTYEKKFMPAGSVEWMGRVMITCNTDPVSIRLLPDMDLSNAEKISLLRCRDKPSTDFPPRVEINNTLDVELPSLCRWLLNFQTPGLMEGSSRMGLKPCHDAVLFDIATQSGPAFSFLELVRLFLRNYFQENPDSIDWQGSATDLQAQINADETLRPLLHRSNPNALSAYLGQLRAKGFRIQQRRNRTTRTWILNKALMSDKGAIEEDK